MICASSNPGDVVLDPFCGCGTTIAVAERLRRRWVGIDISPTAMEIMKRRIAKLSKGSVKPNIVGMPITMEAVRALKPFEFQNWVVSQVHGTHSPRRSHDMGIDGYSFLTRDPIQVKQSDKVGRNVVDNFETAMRRGKHDVGYIFAYSFTRDAKEEVARAKWEDHLTIHLVKVADLLRQPERRPLARLMPQPGSVVDLPIPSKRPPQDLPTAEELVQSDQRAG